MLEILKWILIICLAVITCKIASRANRIIEDKYGRCSVIWIGRIYTLILLGAGMYFKVPAFFFYFLVAILVFDMIFFNPWRMHQIKEYEKEIKKNLDSSDDV